MLLASASTRRCSTTSTTPSPRSGPRTRTTVASCSSSTRSASTAGTTRPTCASRRSIMTGFTMDWEDTSFRYEPAWHHTGRVRSWAGATRTPRSGGDQVARATSVPGQPPFHRAAHRVKPRRNGSSPIDPPMGLVEQLADEYLRHDTAIKPVLRKLFRSLGVRRARSARRCAGHWTTSSATIAILGIKADRNGTDGMRGLVLDARAISGTRRSPGSRRTATPTPPTTGARRVAPSGVGTCTRRSRRTGGRTIEPPRPAQEPAASETPRTHGGLVDTLAKRLVFRELPSAHRTADPALPRRARVRPARRGLRRRCSGSSARSCRLILDTPSFMAR